MAGTYTVVSGDTLSGIAAKSGVPQASITGYKSGNPNLIYPGEVLSLGGGVPAPVNPAPGPAAPAAQPFQPATPNAPAPVQGANGGDTELQQLAKTSRNPSQETRYQELLKTAGSAGATGTSTNLGTTFSPQVPTLNLPDLYTSLSKSAGISDLEAELTAKETAFNGQTSKINDNPWLSEADRTGRIAKLTTDYNNGIKTTQDSLTMKKQDIATQLDLQTKQFDINSTTAKQALDEFNTLLSSGALAGASGADVAAITKATGISSTEIQSAINSQSIKDTPTSVTTVDDGKNQYSVVINSKTGAIISKTILAASKPDKATGGATTTQNQQQYESWVATDAKNGATLEQIVANYGGAGGLSIDDIYRVYNANSKYGPALETIAQVKSGNYSNQQSFVQDQTSPGYTTPAKKPFSILDPSTWY